MQTFDLSKKESEEDRTSIQVNTEEDQACISDNASQSQSPFELDDKLSIVRTKYFLLCLILIDLLLK